MAAGKSGSVSQVGAALDRLDAWVGDGANGDRWRSYLRIDDIRRQLAAGDQADPAAVARSLRRFRSAAPGLSLPRFQAAADALQAWQQELFASRGDDLPQLALASRGDHRPVTAERFAQARSKAARAAAVLLRRLGGEGATLATGWQQYLRWDQVAPVFDADHEMSVGQWRDLDDSLRRLRANVPGLEAEEFRTLRTALEDVRQLAPWARAAERGQPAAGYDQLLGQFAESLRRHAQRPTSETTWQAGRLLGVIDALGDSPFLVAAVRKELVRPNVVVAMSGRLIRQRRTETVTSQTPVRDWILGTRIVGTAHTTARATIAPTPGGDHVSLAISLTGQARSSTVGYHDPVRIGSTGVTAFTGFKQVEISDAGFRATPSTAQATTRTQTRWVQKTGGKFGRRVVEKVAWRRIGEQKRQAEAIAARHAEARVRTAFDEAVAESLAESRARYDDRFRHPLLRRGIFPDPFLLTSTATEVRIVAGLTRRGQLAAGSEPPSLISANDLTIQIHDSAVNNFLPLPLAGAVVVQESLDAPPQFQGDVPAWLRQASQRPLPNMAPLLAAARAIPFKPWSMTLHREAPVSIRFDDGKLRLRIRAATLVSQEDEYRNWDLLLDYQVFVEGEEVVLKRTGPIEAFPANFDPQWDTRMSAQQSGFRSTLAKNLNARADAGQSFPREIRLPPLQVAGDVDLRLRQIACDNQWLSLGYDLQPTTENAHR